MAQLVVFDCHGVLVGSEALSSVIYAETLTAFGCALDAETRTCAAQESTS